MLGTREYLSPERLRGAPATPVDDVWAVGVLGHQLLTGIRPDGEPVVLPASAPAGLRAALTAAVDPDPRRRPADGAALVALLPGPRPASWALTPPGPAATRAATSATPRPVTGDRGRGDPAAGDGADGGRPARAAAVLTGCVLLGGVLATAFPDLAAVLVR